MSYPAFFDTIEKITLHDPLCQLLGSNSDGILHYSYTDVVKLAGHSCPTVAGAYIMTLQALKQLYGSDTPQRGGIKVQFHDDVADGVTGVKASVVSLLTGCAAEGGFKGIGGHHARRGLLSFNAPIKGQIRFERMDTGAAITVSYHPEVVPPSPVMALLRTMFEGSATPDQAADFASGWQERVKLIFQEIDNPQLISYA